jgi:hypothetical protein
MEGVLEVAFSVLFATRLYNSDSLAMKNSCKIDASQRERKPLNTEAEEPLPGSAQ